MRLSSIVLVLAAGCTLGHASPHASDGTAEPDPVDVSISADVPTATPHALPAFEDAPPASERLTDAFDDDVEDTIDSWFAGHGSKRVHVQLDRPLYRPGETVWLKTWSVDARDLADDDGPGIQYELLNPRGEVVETKLVAHAGGKATNDFVLPQDAPGGKWMVRATLQLGEIDERPFVVASYQTPRIRKSLEFVREAYGPGDRVEALVELERTGGPLANHPVRAMLSVAGQTVLETELTTDESGAVLVSGALPAGLTSSDGLLTVLVDEGGVTESISRSVPIALADIGLAFFPEGGDLVNGLPGRIYFEATNRHGEPADVAGTITDDRGNHVADFGSIHDGLGRFAFTPEKGRRYTARITSPAGIDTAYALPEANREGCVLRSYDDVDGTEAELRVGVRCSTETDVLVAGVLRDRAIDTAAVAAGPDADAVVHLANDELADQQGAARVTVFDADMRPLAERLVYRNAGRDLNITVTPDADEYGPRDEVVLKVKATDPSGDPVAAELALSVVDDAVISMADDEEGHMLSRLYLEPELLDSPKDPAFYFDDEEALATRGLDLVMGTKGYRRFEWTPVFEEQALVAAKQPVWDLPYNDLQYALAGAVAVDEVVLMERRRGFRVRNPFAMQKQKVPMMAAAPPMGGAPEPEPEPMEVPEVMDEDLDVAMLEEDEVDKEERLKALPAKQQRRDHRQAKKDKILNHGAGGRALQAELQGLGYIMGDIAGGEALGWAPVRVFPAPAYESGFTGQRTDFRDTVHWEPSLRTDAKGVGEVRFFLSDAVTTFRVTAEGLGGSYAGHGEATLTSVLPVSIATKLPTAVSAGDQLMLPVSITNTRDADLDVALGAVFDGALHAHLDASSMQVSAASTDTWWIPVDVGSGDAEATIQLSAEGGGLSDSLSRTLTVAPVGYPRSWSASGESDRTHRFDVPLDADVVEGSLTASVTWHPSTVSTLITGMEGLIRQPGGCFEQTSSTNWPNVSILNYLEAHEGDPRLKVQSSKNLKIGYDLLTGYQVKAGGFETFGNGPGKEALSAFGLLQFDEMSRVYPVDDKVLRRDVEYLLSQRDGKGGFRNSGESAHGYGSAPKPVLDGFITYALVATGHGDGLNKELAQQAETAESTEDPYVLALAARTMAGAEHPDTSDAIDRLVAMQAEDGSFPGAASSITRSYEANLLVESTAIAALALMEAGGERQAADKAASWLVDNRQGQGTWGATQATALALAALSKHADVNRAPRTAGSVSIEINGEVVGTLNYKASQTDPLVIDGFENHLVHGENRIVLRQDEGAALPFSIDVAWTSVTPSSADGAELSVTTELDRTELPMGETVRMTARVTNEAGRIVPSPIARIGLPAGLEAPLWQLQQLQERGEIAFFETRPREITLYWEGIHEAATHEVKLDLAATVPGTYTAPATSAYPYYNDDEKGWAAGTKVTILRP